MSRSFGLDAPMALRAFRGAAERFKADLLNEDLARDCAIKAWQLCDHVFNGFGPASRFAKLSDLQEHVRALCPELGNLQDVCTETKHGRITRYTPRIVRARHRPGDFDPNDFSSEDFDTADLEIELPSGRTVLFSEAVDCALVFWSQFFEDHRLARGGPMEPVCRCEGLD